MHCVVRFSQSLFASTPTHSAWCVADSKRTLHYLALQLQALPKSTIERLRALFVWKLYNPPPNCARRRDIAFPSFSSCSVAWFGSRVVYLLCVLKFIALRCCLAVFFVFLCLGVCAGYWVIKAWNSRFLTWHTQVCCSLISVLLFSYRKCLLFPEFLVFMPCLPSVCCVTCWLTLSRIKLLLAVISLVFDCLLSCTSGSTGADADFFSDLSSPLDVKSDIDKILTVPASSDSVRSLSVVIVCSSTFSFERALHLPMATYFIHLAGKFAFSSVLFVMDGSDGCCHCFLWQAVILFVAQANG